MNTEDIKYAIITIRKLMTNIFLVENFKILKLLFDILIDFDKSFLSFTFFYRYLVVFFLLVKKLQVKTQKITIFIIQTR